jgi:hypothetical protein
MKTQRNGKRKEPAVAVNQKDMSASLFFEELSNKTKDGKYGSNISKRDPTSVQKLFLSDH